MPFFPDSNHRKAFDSDGFVVVDNLIDQDTVAGLHDAFEDVFCGRFQTGVRPDEVNWQQGESDPKLTRQICNGWKANRRIAETVLNENLGRAVAEFAGWSGVRIMIDNVIWKPPGAKSLGFHQDNAYLSWFTPGEILTCWIALDDTSASGGTIEFARGSHRWELGKPTGEFHAPADYRKTVREAAARAGVDAEICHVETKAGGGSFHHGATWHGSGPNLAGIPRRSLVLHAMPSEVRYVPSNFEQGIGPIYSRYKRLGDNSMDENFFPIIWRSDGYRTPQIEDHIRGAES
ncbi:MAG: phytanoyl-CoA dioxygenase family protein [Pseudomonadota bacterium]